MVTKIGRWSATHPLRAIIVWLVVIVTAAVGGSSIGARQATEVDLGVGESCQSTELIDAAALQQPAVENFLIAARSGTLDQQQAAAAASELAGRLRGLPEVSQVSDPIPAPTGQSLLITAQIAGNPETADERVQPLRDATAAVQESYPELQIDQAGPASIRADFFAMLDKDVNRATFLSVPVTLLVLLVAFAALVAAGVPVLLGLSSVFAGIGLWALASHLVPDPGMVMHVIVLMGMAVGVDYSLFYLRRVREERIRGRSTTVAVSLAAATSGRAVLVSGVAVTVSMAGLYLANDTVFSAMATGAILTVAVAIVSSLTVLPAILVKVGDKVDRPRVPVLWRLTGKGPNPRLWSALLRPALRHPVVTFIVATGALLALAYPMLAISLKTTATDDFPRTLAAMRSYDRIVAEFPSRGITHVVVARVPSGRESAGSAAMDRLSDRIEEDSLFARDQQPERRTSTDGRTFLLEVATPYPSDSPEAERALDRLRNDLVPTTIGNIPGAEYAVGGEVASNVDYTDNVAEKLPFVLGAVLLLALVIMAAAFRSIVVALTAILLNLLSIAAAFGALALIFQNSWAEGLLGFESTGHVVAWVPMFLLVVLFGLSMDYHVFVVSRIRESVLAGMSTRDAIADGITRSAGVVTSAAAVMVSVFAIFAALSFIEMKQIGVGLAIAVIIDATIIRVVVLPSLMSMLGRANWWPSREVKVVPATARTQDPEMLPTG